MQTVEAPVVTSEGAQVHSTERILWMLAVTGVLLIWGYIIATHLGQPGDDPYITYRYARNVAEGNGFVYNIGERVQSTTTPLLTLILAIGALIGLDIPFFSYLLSALTLLLFGVCCVVFVGRVDPARRWLALGAIALTFVSIVTINGFGTEMPLLVALSWGSWVAAARDRWALAAALAALATVTRGDGVLVAASLAICYFMTHRNSSGRRWNWGAALVYLLVAMPWYLFAWFYFGSPLPATLGSKIAQGTAPGATAFFEGLGFFWSRSFGLVTWVAVVSLILLAVGAVVIARHGWMQAMPLIWALLFTTGYSVLSVSRYPWYYSPLVPVAMLAIMYGAWTLAEFVIRWPPRSSGRSAIRAALILGLIAPVGVAQLMSSRALERSDPAPKYQLYIMAARWVAANTPPTATLGSDEVGYLGFYSRRRFIDFVGLIQPEVAPYNARHDNVWVVKKYQPDYILAMPVWMETVWRDPWVSAHYTVVRTFEFPGSDPGQLLQKKQ